LKAHQLENCRHKAVDYKEGVIERITYENGKNQKQEVIQDSLSKCFRPG